MLYSWPIKHRKPSTFQKGERARLSPSIEFDKAQILLLILILYYVSQII